MPKKREMEPILEQNQCPLSPVEICSKEIPRCPVGEGLQAGEIDLQVSHTIGTAHVRTCKCARQMHVQYMHKYMEMYTFYM